MTCLVPGCGLNAEPCGFCPHHVAKISPAGRADIVARWERISGEKLTLASQEPAAQGDLFGAPR